MDRKIRIAVLGAGGLGKACAKVVGMKKELSLVAICDSSSYSYSAKGLDSEVIYNLESKKSVGKKCNDSIGEIIKLKNKIDAVFVALPNLPNEFIPQVIKRFSKAQASLVFTDALKRTSAAKLMFSMGNELKQTKSVYI